MYFVLSLQTIANSLKALLENQIQSEEDFCFEVNSFSLLDTIKIEIFVGFSWFLWYNHHVWAYSEWSVGSSYQWEQSR